MYFMTINLYDMYYLSKSISHISCVLPSRSESVQWSYIVDYKGVRNYMLCPVLSVEKHTQGP